MEVFIFLNFHPPGNDLIFGPTCPQPRALLKKILMFQQNLKNDHAPEKI